ncbi:MAG TPA: IS1595 family transposase [Planctomycetota bacterium]|nr:IS1595 family transposase [Planctomycetota bacterium]
MLRILVPSGRGMRDLLPWSPPGAAFDERFGTEEACRDFLFAARWPDGFVCRNCGRAPFRWLTSRKLQCLSCRKANFLTSGTILHGTRKPLKAWFRAAYLVVQLGANARVLQEELRLTYKVAWAWAHKLRSLMELGTTLPAPVPPFNPESPVHVDRKHVEASHKRWFLAHGHFEWQASRQGGLGKCCERLDGLDWDVSVPTGLRIEGARQRLFRNYSGHVSEYHLPAYLKETEFRLNHRGLPAIESAVELMNRVGSRGARPYAQIRVPRARREPLWFFGPGATSIALPRQEATGSN